MRVRAIPDVAPVIPQKPGLRVLVTGSRNWRDDRAIFRVLRELPKDAVIVHGGADGADTLASFVANIIGLEVEVHPADWDRYGRAAGPIRNKEMLDSGIDLVLAFWKNKSRGTRHTILEAGKRNIQVVLTVSGE